MPGPNVHLASVEQSSFLIKKITNIPIIIGNSADVCEPNILHDHVTWNAKTWEGSLFDRIQAHFERIKIYRKDRRTVDNFFSRDIRYICHYLTDFHMIGQETKINTLLISHKNY